MTTDGLTGKVVISRLVPVGLEEAEETMRRFHARHVGQRSPVVNLRDNGALETPDREPYTWERDRASRTGEPNGVVAHSERG